MEVICGASVTKGAWLNEATVAPPVVGVAVAGPRDEQRSPVSIPGIRLIGSRSVIPAPRGQGGFVSGAARTCQVRLRRPYGKTLEGTCPRVREFAAIGSPGAGQSHEVGP